MKNDITYEYRKSVKRPNLTVGHLEIGECTLSVLKNDLKKPFNGAFSGRLYHTVDTNQFFYDFEGKRYELNLFGGNSTIDDAVLNKALESIRKDIDELKKRESGLSDDDKNLLNKVFNLLNNFNITFVEDALDKISNFDNVVKQATDKAKEEISGEITKAINDADIPSIAIDAINSIDIEGKVNTEIENADIESKVNDIIISSDIPSKIDDAVKNIDFSDSINNAINDADIPTKVQESIDGFDFDSKVNDVIVNADIPSKINTEIENANISDKVEEAIIGEIEKEDGAFLNAVDAAKSDIEENVSNAIDDAVENADIPQKVQDAIDEKLKDFNPEIKDNDKKIRFYSNYASCFAYVPYDVVLDDDYSIEQEVFVTEDDESYTPEGTRMTFDVPEGYEVIVKYRDPMTSEFTQIQNMISEPISIWGVNYTRFVRDSDVNVSGANYLIKINKITE